MTRPEDRLDDILRAARDAADLTSRGKAAYEADRLLQRAAKNIVAEIGEAAKAVPAQVLDQITGVPWRAVKGMRDRVMHDYPEVDLDILWDTLATSIPALAGRILAFRQTPPGTDL
ncbi:MAG: HepT-like ribonuclease domain-containing protein [Acidimicrobiia bacterium]